ncbi:MAG: CDP-2,3-bis-(O-geranylgeranyl)-sn-glycerol synthase [Thermoprotei archaeon]|nr:MAG: CDP-2,3-bis-(O-geranylgeranyl)-sn-glycerol synthase [Thermoprotei archaeon]RLF18572.1 MAG: CDP-2,3-bis-(O-geranylgeranyl)-sn-glycerol synthase [Thermoprotei archaeon]
MAWYVEELIEALLFILPAYVANAAPLLLTPWMRVRHPMDFGLSMSDGKRILGDTKSWEGFAFGITLGTFTGALISKPLLGLALSVGAMIGDLAGSFIKRRAGIEPGHPIPVLDQLDFLVGALILAYILGETLSPVKVLILVVITPPIHLATNTFAYLLGFKDRPY